MCLVEILVVFGFPGGIPIRPTQYKKTSLRTIHVFEIWDDLDVVRVDCPLHK